MWKSPNGQKMATKPQVLWSSYYHFKSFYRYFEYFLYGFCIFFSFWAPRKILAPFFFFDDFACCGATLFYIGVLTMPDIHFHQVLGACKFWWVLTMWRGLHFYSKAQNKRRISKACSLQSCLAKGHKNNMNAGPLKLIGASVFLLRFHPSPLKAWLWYESSPKFM